MMPDDGIIALGLLTQRDVDRLGPTFKRIYAIDETPCFGELLAAIDEADREIRQARDAAQQDDVSSTEVPSPHSSRSE